MAELKWYVIRAISGQEKKIKAYLETEILRRNYDNYIPQILIPAEKIFEMRNGKKRVREKSFFPGYILINADLSNGEVAPLITNIPGVLGFLGDNGSTSKTPISLRQAEINRILGVVDEIAETGEKIISSFIIGELVKVMDGPFNGFTGTVEEVFEERKKLNVMVKIFGRNTPIELNYVQVEKQD
jgi:transcription termination/antitermination protein NusG